MKRILQFFLLPVLLILGSCCCAQVPSLMRYQAVVRDAAGNLLISKPVGIQVSILKGSATGVAVYIETQSPTTNANGLFSVSIGAGNLIAGSYKDIDWSSGIYYMKVDISLTNDAIYTITSTSEILSVPYALNAQTANSLAGQNLHTHLDTLFLTGKDYTILPGLRILGLLGDVQRLLGIGFTPLELYSIGYPLDSLYGKTYQGGILYWLDINTGHGLIVAPTPLSKSKVWSDIPIIPEIVTSTAVGTGQDNTTNIVEALGSVRDGGNTKGGSTVDADYAAVDCDRLIFGGYDDWYLPSVDDLDKLFRMIANSADLNLADFDSNIKASYWTSSYAGNGSAFIYMVSAYSSQSADIRSKAVVLPVRSF